ncbi:uncharacterized protein LOC110830686 [Zootermopsis nevadensis]|uniref:uncharacterized protein LOC110830686 n=1 Tax=Zootermopsis nevadensis TaxID=136037 RepID=UPI000B8E601D|nr:uncharacterized protein LOC110830686 [Zootermopsis nevadensis]
MEAEKEDSEFSTNNMEDGGRGKRIRKRPVDSYFSDSQSVAFNEWPHHEKVALLDALKKYGHCDIVNLTKAVPGKNKEQIKMVIRMWWKAARTAMQASACSEKRNKDNLKCVSKRTGRPPGPSKRVPEVRAPIDQWLHMFEQSEPGGGYSQMKLLSKVFLYISKYENHPPPEDCNGVDYREMYEYLYCMLNGYPGKTLNPETAVFVLNSLNEMAVDIRKRGMQKETFFLDCVQRLSGEVRQYGGKKKNIEPDLDPVSPEAVMKNLNKIQGFNPLNVPINLLKK